MKLPGWIPLTMALLIVGNVKAAKEDWWFKGLSLRAQLDWSAGEPKYGGAGRAWFNLKPRDSFFTYEGFSELEEGKFQFWQEQAYLTKVMKISESEYAFEGTTCFQKNQVKGLITNEKGAFKFTLKVYTEGEKGAQLLAEYHNRLSDKSKSIFNIFKNVDFGE